MKGRCLDQSLIPRHSFNWKQGFVCFLGFCLASAVSYTKLQAGVRIKALIVEGYFTATVALFLVRTQSLFQADVKPQDGTCVR